MDSRQTAINVLRIAISSAPSTSDKWKGLLGNVTALRLDSPAAELRPVAGVDGIESVVAIAIAAADDGEAIRLDLAREMVSQSPERLRLSDVPARPVADDPDWTGVRRGKLP